MHRPYRGRVFNLLAGQSFDLSSITILVSDWTVAIFLIIIFQWNFAMTVGCENMCYSVLACCIICCVPGGTLCIG